LSSALYTSLKVHNAKQAAKKLPGDGAPPDWWQGDEEDPEVEPTRLSPECEEPEDPPEDVGGWGPDKIYCCHTAQALVEDLQTKKEHCDADPPVDCWKSLREVLPNYIAHFTQRRDWLCRTTTSTTTTITTTTLTTTSAVAFEGDLRLVPPGRHRGRLEIYHKFQWGTICEDQFEVVDATVACRQLGLPNGAPIKNTFGQGTGDIWMDDMGCAGDEDKLMNCSHNGWGIQNCGHAKDVAIACEPTPPGAAPAPAPGIDWCLELCLHHTEAERVKCENLCREIYARTVHRDECAEVVETGPATTTFPAAPAPSGPIGL